MYIEYRNKFKILKEIKKISRTELGVLLGYEDKIVANNTVRRYENGDRIPPESTILQICQKLNISYDFFSNYNYSLAQEEKIVIDLIWLELINNKCKILKYNSKEKHKNNRILFKPSSPIIRKYIEEIIKNRELNQDNTFNKYYQYIFNFPYSSNIFEKGLFNLLNPKISLNSEYIPKNSYYLEYFKNRMNKNEFLNNIKAETNLPSYINIEYKIQKIYNLQNKHNHESFKSFNKEKYYGELKFNPSKKILSSTVTVKQAELLEDALQAPLCRFVDTYDINKEYADAFISSLVWNDIYNKTFTLESNNEDGYYFEDDNINNYLKSYFNYQEKYNNDNNYKFNDYILDILKISKIKTLNDVCEDIIKDKILLSKITQE